jgi:hypothetical protein
MFPAPHVFGYGIGQWSPIEYTLYYKTRGRRFHPHVLFVFLTFNDYRDDGLIWAECRFSPEGEPLACPAPADDYARAGERIARPGSMLVDLVRAARARRPWALIGRGLREQVQRGAVHEEGRDELLGMFDARRIETTRSMARRSFRLLGQLFDAARQDGATPILVLIPWPQQVGAREWALGRVPWGVPVDYLEHSTILQDVTRDAARETGITTLDLLPALRQHAVDERMFFPYDGHFSAAGARTVAQALAEAVSTIRN